MLNADSFLTGINYQGWDGFNVEPLWLKSPEFEHHKSLKEGYYSYDSGSWGLAEVFVGILEEKGKETEYYIEFVGGRDPKKEFHHVVQTTCPLTAISLVGPASDMAEYGYGTGDYFLTEIVPKICKENVYDLNWESVIEYEGRNIDS